MNSQWVYENKETVEIVPFKPVQTVVETDAALQGGLREETKIYYAGAYSFVRSAELSGSRISADGKIHFKVLYAQGDMSKVIPLEIAADFSQIIPVHQDQQDNANITVQVMSDVEDVEAKVHNGRITLRAIVRLQGCIRCEKTLRCVNITEDSERIQKKVQHITVSKISSEGEVQSNIRDEVELSELLQIDETLFANAYAIVEDVKPTGSNKVAVIGTVLVDAYHTSHMPQRPLISTQHKIPFEQEISLQDSGSNYIAAKTQVQDVAVVSQDQEDEHDGKLMRCEILLHSVVRSISQEEKEVVCDAYTLHGEGMETVSQLSSWPQTYVCEEAAESGRLTLNLPDQSPRVKQPLLTFMDPVIIKKKSNGNRLQVDCMIQSTVLYLTDDSDVPVSVKITSPFTAVFNTSSSPDDYIKLYISEPSLSSVTGDRVEARYILHLSSEGERTLQTPILTDIVPSAEAQTMHGVSICFVQPGESLWDIAKHYRVPEEVIVQENKLDNNMPMPGVPLIIHSMSKNKQNEHA